MRRHGRRSSEHWPAVGDATAPDGHVAAAGRRVRFFLGTGLFVFLVGAVAVADDVVGAGYASSPLQVLIFPCAFVVRTLLPMRLSRPLPNETGPKRGGAGLRLPSDRRFVFLRSSEIRRDFWNIDIGDSGLPVVRLQLLRSYIPKTRIRCQREKVRPAKIQVPVAAKRV